MVKKVFPHQIAYCHKTINNEDSIGQPGDSYVKDRINALKDNPIGVETCRTLNWSKSGDFNMMVIQFVESLNISVNFTYTVITNAR